MGLPVNGSDTQKLCNLPDIWGWEHHLQCHWRFRPQAAAMEQQSSIEAPIPAHKQANDQGLLKKRARLVEDSDEELMVPVVKPTLVAKPGQGKPAGKVQKLQKDDVRPGDLVVYTEADVARYCTDTKTTVPLSSLEWDTNMQFGQCRPLKDWLVAKYKSDMKAAGGPPLQVFAQALGWQRQGVHPYNSPKPVPDSGCKNNVQVMLSEY